jgi:hypothetical protein
VDVPRPELEPALHGDREGSLHPNGFYGTGIVDALRASKLL